MGFKNFRLTIIFRLVLLTLSLSTVLYLFQFEDKYITVTLLCFLVIYQVYDLFIYVDHTNKKLKRFFESIRYADFSSNFTYDNTLGKSFKELNEAFTEVINAFQKIRLESEENLLYLNTVVQHVAVGLIAYDQNGKIELINNAAKKLLKVTFLRNIGQLGMTDKVLEDVLKGLKTGENVMIKVGGPQNERQVVMNATEFRLRGKNYKLVSIQDIQNELDNKELEAWQNLTRVLRHEIMNSVTPIASLSSFAIDLLDSEWKNKNTTTGLQVETVQDIWESLETIEKRCQSLINFVEGYRSFTSIPSPIFQWLLVEDMLKRVMQLLQADRKSYNVGLECKVLQDGLKLYADQNLVEMVLINLLKNAFQALENSPEGLVEVRAFNGADNHVIIQVEDNGPGIIPEALEKIFIPFYTTKKGGSGIGLSWSRQILNLHKGTLTIQSKPGHGTVFTLHF